MTGIDLEKMMRDPRTQKALRKMANESTKGGDNQYSALVRNLLTPEVAKFMDTEIAGARLGLIKSQGKERINLGKESLALKAGTTQADIASREKMSLLSNESRKATTLAGIESRQGIDEGRLGLKRDAFEYDKSQVLPSALISGAGVPLQYALNRQEKAELEALRKLRDRRPYSGINNYDAPPV